MKGGEHRKTYNTTGHGENGAEAMTQGCKPISVTEPVTRDARCRPVGLEPGPPQLGGELAPPGFEHTDSREVRDVPCKALG